MDEQMTITEMAAAIPEIWSSAFYDVLLAALPMNESVSRDYQGEIAALGDTVNVTQVPEFDMASELAEGAKNNAESVTLANIQLIINKMLVKDFIITKRAMIQSIDTMNKLRDLAIYSIAKKMQSNIFADVVPSTSPDHSIAYTSGTTLALADILAAKELLDNADVPSSMRTMIVGAAQFNDIFLITGFQSSDFVAGANGLSSGQINIPLLGFDFKWTTEAGSTSYFFHNSFYQIAVQQVPVVEVFNKGVEGERATRVNVTALYGQKQFASDRVVTIA
jgi:hypothetical protein